MKTKIFYTTNAGLYFCSESSEILVDGIHDAGSVGYYPMDDKMRIQMLSAEGLFAGSGALLFTHLHKDHYDEEAVNEYLRQHPDSAIWGPGLTATGLSDIRNEEGKCSFRYGNFRIEAYETKHSGPRYMKVPHYSLLVQNVTADEVFFVAGDAAPEPDLGSSIRREYGECTGGIYAFVMAYQLAEKKSRHFLEELKPTRIFLIHQPREEDEAYRMVSHIMKYAIRETPDGVTVETPAPMTWIE